MKKFEKEPDIISVGEPGSGRSIGFDPTEKVSAKPGERVQNRPEL